jgi:hypothetical protein
MDTGALGRAAKRHAGKGIAIVAVAAATAAIFTASASATSSGETTLHLAAKAAATVATVMAIRAANRLFHVSTVTLTARTCWEPWPWPEGCSPLSAC